MLVTQEPKYDCTPDGRIVNRSTHRVIPDNEPVFILRAKDVNALPALRFYMAQCRDPDQRAVVRSRALDFEAFALDNPHAMKEPDCSKADLAAANVGRAPFEPPAPYFNDAQQKAAAGVQKAPITPFIKRVADPDTPEGSES